MDPGKCCGGSTAMLEVERTDYGVQGQVRRGTVMGQHESNSMARQCVIPLDLRKDKTWTSPGRTVKDIRSICFAELNNMA